ncbi:MAG: hypothetical protein LBJ62_10890 [Bifidobacteriaceae bacterium]|nr:hypothetical protein [Bifidobacteriaceae bacterium]
MRTTVDLPEALYARVKRHAESHQQSLLATFDQALAAAYPADTYLIGT